MNTKYLMVSSSMVTGFFGLIASFMPNEIMNHLGVTTIEYPSLFVQITGALYLGFAIMNWMAKTVLIGGIYARPLGMGNLVHFTVAALALLKSALSSSGSVYIWGATILYSVFAILFGLVIFTNPQKLQAKTV